VRGEGRNASSALLRQAWALDFALPQIAALDLARHRHRKIVDELELARIFVRRKAAPERKRNPPVDSINLVFRPAAREARPAAR
jgi:hypothetical protein